MRTKQVSPKIEYIRNNFAEEDALLKEVAARVDELGVKGMQVGPEEGKVLQFLISSFNLKKIVELGTLGCYSSIWMARGIAGEGKVYTLERDERHYKVAVEMRDKSEVRDKIEIIFGDAKEKLSELEKQGPFDMIFIDADKTAYCDYLDWAEKNIRIGGVIVGDNTFLFDTVYYEEAPEKVSKASHQAMRQFNKRLSDKQKYRTIMLPTEEGMTIAVKLF